MSMRNAKFQREPAGRLSGGGMGVTDCATVAVWVKGNLDLGERQLAGGGVVVE